jgi:hypothetical protein
MYQDLTTYRSGIYSHVTGQYLGGHAMKCTSLINLLFYNQIFSSWVGLEFRFFTQQKNHIFSADIQYIRITIHPNHNTSDTSFIRKEGKQLILKEKKKSFRVNEVSDVLAICRKNMILSPNRVKKRNFRWGVDPVSGPYWKLANSWGPEW